jgi:hypothetical protein
MREVSTDTRVHILAAESAAGRGGSENLEPRTALDEMPVATSSPTLQSRRAQPWRVRVTQLASTLRDATRVTHDKHATRDT